MIIANNSEHMDAEYINKLHESRKRIMATVASFDSTISTELKDDLLRVCTDSLTREIIMESVKQKLTDIEYQVETLIKQSKSQ